VNLHRSRTVTLGGIALALALGAAVAPATATTSSTHANDKAAAALAQAKALFSGKLAQQQRSAARQASKPFRGVDATPILVRLRAEIPAMTPAQRAQANAILARPDEGAGDRICTPNCAYISLDPATTQAPYGSTNFLIHYDANSTLADAAATSAVLENVWKTEITKMGFQRPVRDYTGPHPSTDPTNVDDRVDIYLADLRPLGIYGYCSPDEATEGGYYYKSTAYCVLDNDFAGYRGTPDASRKVTAAHEFFHAIQFGYNYGTDYHSPWMAEGSAVWMENQVYPSITDYYQYLPASPIRRPLVPFTYNGDIGVYGDFTIFKFLQKRYNDPAFVKKIWSSLGSNLSLSAIGAVSKVLKAHHTTLAKAIPIFGMWNTLIPGSYPQWKSYRPAGAWKVGYLKVGQRSKNFGVKVRPLATAPFVVLPKGKQARAKAKLTVSGPKSVGGVWVQIRLKNGSVKKFHLALNRKGKAVHTYAFKPKATSAIIVTMTNGASSGSARKFTVQLTLKK